MVGTARYRLSVEEREIAQPARTASVLQNPYTEQCLTWETIDTQLYMKLRIQRRDIRFHGTQ